MSDNDRGNDSQTDRVLVEVADHVASVTLNRPERHNALDLGVFEGLVDAAARLADEPGLRAVVLSGAGKSFCSGIDITGLAGGGADLTDLVTRHGGTIANLFQRAAYDWRRLPVPVIAAIHGNCFGGGLQVALGADIRIVAPDARLSVMEVKWGLVPDMALSTVAPGLLRLDVAKLLTFTGEIVAGADAVGYGLATELSDTPLERARALATEIAGKSPHAVRAAKSLYDRTWEGMPDPDRLALESELQQALMLSPNQIEAVRAGTAGEPPQFTD